MEIPRICSHLETSGTVIVYDIAKARIVLEVSNGADSLDYYLYKYDYSSMEPRIDTSKCSLIDGAEALLNAVNTAPTYWLWEGEPYLYAYAGVGGKFHASYSCPKRPIKSVQWKLFPRDLAICPDLWCKLCARPVHAPTQGKWLSPDWANWPS